MKRFARHIAIVWLAIFTLLMTAVVSPVAAAAGPITVADAIANNDGAATVEGYIVGTTSTTSSFGTGNFAAPFSVNTNLLLADDPDEREKTKLLPVQLPNNTVRQQLNLVDHAEHLGKKVRISGDLGAYFSVPGLRNASSFSWADGTEPSEPVSIQEARSSLGSRVITEGIVNVDNGVLYPGKLSVYIQDGDAGIQLFSHNANQFPAVKKGDQVRVKGTVGEYDNVTQIIVEELEVLTQNQPVEAKAVTLEQYRDAATAEALEGQLVILEGFIRHVPDYYNGGANVTAINENFDPLTLRIWESTGIDLGLLEGEKWYQITGISSQYRDSYQLLPREQSDLTVSDVQKEKPTTDGRQFEAVVERVVDGDTIRLQEPVLGSTTVRYLNIDTPETYHKVENELDQNQMDHGNRAGAYLGTLLSPGDTVILQLGEEPTDSYGRILAEVVRQDGLNTNLKLVEEGYAATYFIWPFKNEEVERYGAALKSAKEAGKGIWNPDDPLLEQPFVFRARERGDELFRPAGDYRSKTYVPADQWDSIPDEWRVFFHSEADAQRAGYQPQAQTRTGQLEQLRSQLGQYHQAGEVTNSLFKQLDNDVETLIQLEKQRKQAEDQGDAKKAGNLQYQWEKAWSKTGADLEKGYRKQQVTVEVYHGLKEGLDRLAPADSGLGKEKAS
ncbi:DUF6359 domain-containing protein [Desmospora activa]|uniref:Endonuclease YncB(Thermonuclease family) n=1 Tax=Desmospora activa DSM 45169 TaxID=1121389 RepID=A0A2T4ZBU4_9BACL|nr:DUF6359 domain-containing protein [Desmospora activa]PTM59370.1 endonuclease YncB(thermonuclease family) [Desmospora activa DSM 45169]